VNNKNLIENIYPLSPVQQGMLFHTLLAPGSGVYLQQRSCTLHGPLDVTQFRKAWERVVQRHAVLRTAFSWEHRVEPFQVVYRQVGFPWEQHDWRGLAEPEQAEQLETLLARDREQGFDLARAPLTRLILIQLADDVHQFIWSHHHLLLDGWSLGLVLKEVLTDYEALCRGQLPDQIGRRPYADYIAWLGQQDVTQAETFWRQTLKGFRTPTPLGVDRVYVDQARPFAFEQLQIAAATLETLRTLAKQSQLTINTFVQGAWALLLSCYSGETDVLFGATVSGRGVALTGIESMVGLFINTVPVRIEVDQQKSLTSWLKQLQSQQFALQQYEHSALTQIHSWSEVPRGLPLFENVVVFENAPFDTGLWNSKKELRVEDDRYDEQTNYALTVVAMAERAMLLRIIYDCRRFSAATIKRMLGHLEVLLTGMAEQPDQRIADLSLLAHSERKQLLLNWNNTRTDFPDTRCVHERFEEQAARTPEAIAVIFEDEQLTYHELNLRANRLAHHLKSLGAGCETLVVVCMERSVEMVVALFAILKAGAAYVPLEPSYPSQRLASMFEELQAPILLTQEKFVATLPRKNDQQMICLDTDWASLPEGPCDNPSSGVGAENLAYVIYTSGSTGRPKGAMNTHGALCNRLLWMQDAYRLTDADRVLQKTPFSFDVSVWEFFWPLMTGARLVVARPEGHKDSAYLKKLIAKREVTTLHFVPSMLRMFLDEPGLERCRSLRQVIASGEELTVELQEQFFANVDAQLHNLYGPTEAAIDVTFWECRPESYQRLVPIGRPIANTKIYLLDKELRPVPVAVAGELYIGGVALARGYLRQPALTAEKFIPDPFSERPGMRLYRTGDLARFRHDGNIEFLGRNDNQVKIRGFRIELGEIEARLRQHDAVRDAVLRLVDYGSGEKRLVAYVEVDHVETSRDELRRFLKLTLPDHMLPQAFVMLEKLPLTANGKIDRTALPSPNVAESESEVAFVGPRTSIEEAIVRIWSEALGIERVGVYDNFFDLGGHSLLALRVLSRIRNEFEIELQLRSIVDAPTPAELAMVVIQHLAQGIDDVQVKQILQQLESVEAQQIN
jgi:amino acid adenylation domain-containing protein